MSVLTFPSLAGITWPVKRSAQWNTEKEDAISGARTRYQYFSYPRYAYELSFNFLRSDAANLEWQELAGFYNQTQGPTSLFGFVDINDNTQNDSDTAQAFGTGDGVSTAFQLVRALGSFVEPVFLPDANPSIYDNDVLVDPSGYTVGATGVVTFTAPPANSDVLSWTGTFRWPCRFDDDSADFSNFMSLYFDAKSVKFSTEKVLS
jgi:uncharacterized protein (TIGR02217 family)